MSATPRANPAAFHSEVVVVLQCVPEWMEDDGIRSLADPHTYSQTLNRILSELCIPFITIGQDRKKLDERVSCIVDTLTQRDGIAIECVTRKTARYLL